MTIQEFRAIIGNSIRKERLARGMSIDDLAELMGYSTGFIGLVERGKRGTTFMNIWMICEALDIDIRTLVHTDTHIDETSCDVVQKRKKIFALTYMFDESELEFIISCIKGLKAMQSKKKRKIKLHPKQP